MITVWYFDQINAGSLRIRDFLHKRKKNLIIPNFCSVNAVCVNILSILLHVLRLSVLLFFYASQCVLIHCAKCHVFKFVKYNNLLRTSDIADTNLR